ncbi:MAG: hypothetical protein JOS17DRAFT_789504 [Linnemannia elongata]|nr:MAG: hypothetical protein JOS17DRAFT_789504 [Linnemannia elongata]
MSYSKEPSRRHHNPVAGMVLADPTREDSDHPVGRPFPFLQRPVLKDFSSLDDKSHYVLDNIGCPLIPSYVTITNNPSTSSSNDTNTTRILISQDAKTKELITLLISHIKHLAETQAATIFTYPVVTIPSNYTQNQRDTLAGVESFVRVNLDPEYLEVAVAVLDDEVLDTMEILERTEVRAIKRLYNEILKANAIFLKSAPSHSNTLVRIEIHSFLEPLDFSEDLTLSQRQELCHSTSTALLPTVEQVLKRFRGYYTSMDVDVVTGASP